MKTHVAVTSKNNKADFKECFYRHCFLIKMSLTNKASLVEQNQSKNGLQEVTKKLLSPPTFNNEGFNLLLWRNLYSNNFHLEY